ncbi:superoxide dismutase family protein [Candidatus Ulvibacter alkanivorans]|uniref:superoxide dismutase family protein n=1 Tax=Candidatus Ulvibacter alkanivorans TaxID=2267620 RepID=UPI000DF22A88|nr:superoxide dismutase family protein [Candidatus Ulvibacter alkanivorans]
MKKLGILATAIAMLSIVSCKDDKKAEDAATDGDTMETMEGDMNEKDSDMAEAKSVAFSLASKSGSSATGKVEFIEEGGIVRMNAKVMGLQPGMHAIHIHESADCSAADGTSAGGHWNPTFEDHGKWGDSEGYHKGDIGNFEADADGVGTISMQTDEWCIGCDDENKNILGKSIIVHQGADDFTSQPSGAAGARVSCGGIIQ